MPLQSTSIAKILLENIKGHKQLITYHLLDIYHLDLNANHACRYEIKISEWLSLSTGSNPTFF